MKQCIHLAANELNHLPDSHAGGEAVGIHDEIWTDASFAKRHILLPHNIPHHTLLTVPAAELVPKFRPPSMPDQHLEPGFRLADVLLL